MNNKILVGSNFLGFKNRIINGDFSVNQRKDPFVNNESKYPIDRVYVDGINSSLYCTNENIYSPNEGSLVNNTNPFGDGSLNNKYLFDGDATDLLGNNNGVENNVDYVEGKYDNCLFTDQDNTSYVELNGIPKIFDETNKTVSIWVANIKSANTDVFLASAIDSNKNDNRVAFRKFAIQVSSGSNINFSSYPNDDYWHHYCFTVGSNGTRVYIDGKLVASDPKTIINDSGSESYDAYSIGNFWNNIANNTIGVPNLKTDLLEIYTRALTEDEVKKLYVESLNYIQKKHYKCIVTSISDNAIINPYIYKFEGQHIVDLIKDDMALSFELFSTQSGSYTVKLVTECLDGSQETFETTINHSGSDFERFEITIPKGTFTKDIVSDERLGAILYIANNSENLVGLEDVIRLANIQLEKGDTATKFEQVPYDVQLQRCLRYYEELKNLRDSRYCGNAGSYFGSSISISEKRIVPSIRLNINLSGNVTNTIVSPTKKSIWVGYTNSSSNTNMYLTSFDLYADAEL